MDDSDQFYAYRDDYVLMAIDDVLETARPGVTVQLSGSQAEMLRNLVAYGRRGWSWVGAYEDDGYRGPDDDQWDAIYPMVADLEYKLMGNDNTLFGVSDVFADEVYEAIPASPHNMYIGPVPDDEIWVLNTLIWRTVGTVAAIAIASLYKPAVITAAFSIRENLVAGTFYTEPASNVVLGPGYYVQLLFVGVTPGQYVDVRVTGYKMTKTS